MSPEDVEKYSRSDTAWKMAEAKGCIVVEPKANELFVDIDDAAGLDAYEKNIARIREAFAFSHLEKREVRRASPSGKPDRFHIVVTLTRDVEPLERILLQLLLGSDRVREALSWERVRRGDEKPTLFFEKAPAPEEGF